MEVLTTNLREIILRSIGRMFRVSDGSPDGICCYAKRYPTLPSLEPPEVTARPWTTVDLGEMLLEYSIWEETMPSAQAL